MKYLVKVYDEGNKVHTYTTEATDSASAMLEACDKYGVCGVTVSPVEQESARNTALEEAAVLCETAELFFSAELWLHSTKQDMTANTAIELADKIRALKSAAPACPVDTAIANLDALLAERRASTMDHAQLAALGKEKAEERWRQNVKAATPPLPQDFGVRDVEAAKQYAAAYAAHLAWVATIKDPAA